ncbi:MAG: hypothetical protein U0575_07110 [Phycisphaerales bacterium]
MHAALGGAARRRAFTLTELLVTVVILIVIILATSKIFATASKVTSLGQANADLLQTATALERQVRRDIERLTHDGFLVIRSYAVPNNVRQIQFPGASPPAPLLNPLLAPNAIVRSDQLLFFANGVESTQQFVGSAALFDDAGNVITEVRSQQGSAYRVLYAHGVQFGDQMPVRLDPGAFSDGSAVVPWSWDDPNDGPDLETQEFYKYGTGNLLQYNTPPTATPQRVIGSQPEARQWTLARQPVLLGDDGGSLWYYRVGDAFAPSPVPQNGKPGDAPNSAPGLWPNTPGTPFNTLIPSSRVDVAATNLADVRSIVTNSGANTWLQQRQRMVDALTFPRAERESPSMLRADQMLVSPGIAAGCSSFTVEWTYASGVGTAFKSDGTLVPGVRVATGAEQPWFGMPDASRGVYQLSQAGSISGWDWGKVAGGTIFPANIEASGTLNPGAVQYYVATFGYNQSQPLDANDAPNVNLAYTPWPTALRFTVTLHDPRNVLEQGRVFQFVVALPQR